MHVPVMEEMGHNSCSHSSASSTPDRRGRRSGFLSKKPPARYLLVAVADLVREGCVHAHPCDRKRRKETDKGCEDSPGGDHDLYNASPMPGVICFRHGACNGALLAID